MSRRSLIPVLPTAMTLGNLVCGFMAMAKTVDAMSQSGGEDPLDPVFATKILQAAGLIALGMVLDALDGRVARLTKATSDFGAQLDSLADVVTFGVTPALMAKVVYEHGKAGLDQPFMPKVISALCALYVVGAALRLARFTVKTDADESSHHTFEGLPSPAAAALVAFAVIFIFEGRQEIGLVGPWADDVAITVMRLLPFVAAGLGLAMVSRVPYVHVVSRYVGHRTGVTTFVNLAVLGAVVLIFHEWMLFLLALAYVLGGLVLGLRARWTGKEVLDALPEPPVGVDEDEWTGRQP